VQPSLAVRGFKRRRWQCPERSGPWTFSPPLPFPLVVTCKEKSNHNSQLILVVLSLFSDLLFSFLSFFKSAESGVEFCCMRRQQTRRMDGWIDNLPPPTSFLHRRCRPPLP